MFIQTLLGCVGGDVGGAEAVPGPGLDAVEHPGPGAWGEAGGGRQPQPVLQLTPVLLLLGLGPTADSLRQVLVVTQLMCRGGAAVVHSDILNNSLDVEY